MHNLDMCMYNMRILFQDGARYAPYAHRNTPGQNAQVKMRKSKYARSKHGKVSVEQSWYADVFSPRHASPGRRTCTHMGIAVLGMRCREDSCSWRAMFNCVARVNLRYLLMQNEFGTPESEEAVRAAQSSKSHL